MKMSDVLIRAWDLQRHHARYSCGSIGEAFQQMRRRDDTLSTDLRVQTVQFYTEICLIDSEQRIYRESPKAVCFWNSPRHKEHQQMRVEMLHLAHLSAQRYEQYLYAREHDIPWSRDHAYKEL